MQTFTYPCLFTPADEGGFVVTCRDVPEVVTQGDTLAEAMIEAADALDEALQGRIDDEDDIPPATASRRGERLIAPPVGTALKLAIYLAVREAGTNKSELARRLNLDEKEIRRVLDPRHRTKVGRLEEVLREMGRRVDVAVV